MLAGSEPGQPGEWKAKIEVEENIRRASVGTCKTRLRRRFIHGSAADAKFESSRGVIIDQPLNCRVRGNPGTQATATPKGSDWGQPRKPTGGATEGTGTGATWGMGLRDCRKIEDVRGNPERRDQRRYRSSEETGRPGDSNTVARKGERLGATR